MDSFLSLGCYVLFLDTQRNSFISKKYSICTNEAYSNGL